MSTFKVMIEMLSKQKKYLAGPLKKVDNKSDILHWGAILKTPEGMYPIFLRHLLPNYVRAQK